MKKILPFILIFILILLVEVSSAQKVEVTAGVSGSLYNYSGSSAVSNVGAYTYPILSKKLTGSFGFNAQAKFVAEDGFIMGLQTGYDQLRSTANVNSYAVIIDFAPGYVIPGPSLDYAPGIEKQGTAESLGHETNITKYININPFIGGRAKRKSYSFDIMVGANLAYVSEDKMDEVFSNQYLNNRSFYYNRSDLYHKLAKQDLRLKQPPL